MNTTRLACEHVTLSSHMHALHMFDFFHMFTRTTGLLSCIFVHAIGWGYGLQIWIVELKCHVH